MLSRGEKDRLARMKHPDPADRFVGGRILMRRVLGHYLQQDPASIPLTANPAGKPVLRNATAAHPAFSLSHSGGETVLAVAATGDIGIDIETRSRAPAAERIADRFFSHAERRYLSRCGNDRAEKALALWSLKEAIVKAQGMTVWDGLAGVSLTIDGARIVRDAVPPGGGRWTLAAGPFGPSHVLAVAYRAAAGAMPAQAVFRHYDIAGMPVSGGSFKPAYRT